MLRWVCAPLCLFVGCSLSSLDDLKSSGHPDAGSCQAKVDCSRCGNCQDECVCEGAPNLVSCITNCQADGGPGHGGTGGSGGADASAGKGGTAASGGTSASGGSGGTPPGGGSGGVPSGGTGAIGASGGTGGAPTGGGGMPTGGTGGSSICPAANESDFVTCSDGCDNDGNNFTDCADPTCKIVSVCAYTVACGGANCDLNAYTCCKSIAGDTCMVPGTACSGTPINCDGPSDCPGNATCCGVLGPGGTFAEITCLPKDQCLGASNVIVCGGSPSACSAGTQCKQSPKIAGYVLCLP